jgi:hypothetical protein
MFSSTDTAIASRFKVVPMVLETPYSRRFRALWSYG